MQSKPVNAKEKALGTKCRTSRRSLNVVRPQHGSMLTSAVAAILVFVLFIGEGIVAIIVHNKWALRVTTAFHAIAITGLSANCIWLVRRCRE